MPGGSARVRCHGDEMPANCGMAEAGAARARLAGRERHEQQVNDRDRVHGGAGKCNLIYPPNAPNSATRAAAKRVRGRPLSMVLSMKSSRCQPRKTAIGRGRRSIFSTRQQRRGVNASCNRAVRGSSPRVGSGSSPAIPALLTDPWVGSAWEGGSMAAEAEHRECDQCRRRPEAERDPGE